MANRNRSYNEIMANKFDNLEYAQGYLIDIVEDEGLPIDQALRETIEAMGLQKFANRAGISAQEVSDFVAHKHQWSTEELSKPIEKVFKLKVKISLEPYDTSEVT